MTTVEFTATKVAPGRRLGLDQSTRVLCVLFFFSGFPALIYQLTWQRALFRIFGVNIESVTIVVTAFMLGLGLGSLAGGWLSKRPHSAAAAARGDRSLRPAPSALFSLAIFDGVGALHRRLGRCRRSAAVNLGSGVRADAADGRDAAVAGRAIWSAAPATSAVPSACCITSIRSAPARPVWSARCCCFRSSACRARFMSPSAMNGAVAAGALAAHWRDADGLRRLRLSTARRRLHRVPALQLAAVLALAAAGGFVSLSYEIFLFRTVSYASGSSATAFAATLSASWSGSPPARVRPARTASGAVAAKRRCGMRCVR